MTEPSAAPQAAEETASAEAPAAEQADIDYTTGTPWLCSFIDGIVTAETKTPDLKDDFALAVNKEKLQSLTIPDGYSSIGTQESVAMNTTGDIAKLFTSGEKAESHDAQLALNLYSLMTDWDSRNKAGIAPLKKKYRCSGSHRLH